MKTQEHDIFDGLPRPVLRRLYFLVVGRNPKAATSDLKLKNKLRLYNTHKGGQQKLIQSLRQIAREAEAAKLNEQTQAAAPALVPDPSLEAPAPKAPAQEAPLEENQAQESLVREDPAPVEGQGEPGDLVGGSSPERQEAPPLYSLELFQAVLAGNPTHARGYAAQQGIAVKDPEELVRLYGQVLAEHQAAGGKVQG